VVEELLLDEEEERKRYDLYPEDPDPGPDWEVEREMGERLGPSEFICTLSNPNVREVALARAMAVAEVHDVTGLFLEENRGMIGIDECDWGGLGKKKDHHKPRRKKGKHKSIISHAKYKFNKGGNSWTLIENSGDEVKRLKYTPRKRKKKKMQESIVAVDLPFKDYWLDREMKKKDLEVLLNESHTPPDITAKFEDDSVKKVIGLFAPRKKKKKNEFCKNSHRDEIKIPIIFANRSITSDLNTDACELETAGPHYTSQRFQAKEEMIISYKSMILNFMEMIYSFLNKVVKWYLFNAVSMLKMMMFVLWLTSKWRYGCRCELFGFYQFLKIGVGVGPNSLSVGLQ
jgi:hypothetical protein